MTSVAPPVPTLRERRRTRTRDELVTATIGVIADLGLDETTIERIQAASGVSRGTVYAYFPGGRDELLRAAYARIGTELVARTRDAAEAAGSWRGSIAAHALALFELAEDPRIGHFYNVSGPALITSGSERGIGSGASAEMIRAALEEARTAGEVDPALDVATTAILLVGALREAAVRVAAGASDRERAAAAFARLVDGLAVREAGR